MKKTIAIILMIVLIIVLLIIFNNMISKTNHLDIKSEFVNYLESKIQEDGSFEYITNIDHSKSLDDYSILSHSLSYYSLIKAYDNDKKVLDNKKKIIQNGVDFIISRIVSKDDKAYVISDNMEDVDLGNCSMVLILMCEYQNAFEDDRYQNYIEKLADGILSMQRLEGRFNHLYVLNNMVLKEKDVIVYYEGEAVLALCKAYEITRDKKYLDFAKKALDYYISSGYEKYADHWQEYAVLEYLKYDNDIKYRNYGILNICSKIDEINEKKLIYNTDFEVLRSGIFIYNEANEKEAKYSLDEIEKIYENELNSIKNDILDAKNGLKIEDFFAKRGYKSIRIDDLAHYILAFS